MYKVQSYQVAQGINIKMVRAKLNYTLLFAEADELFYQINDYQYLSIFQFGIVSFFNVSDTEIKTIKHQIKNFGRGHVKDSLTEDIVVKITPNLLKVSFNAVELPSLEDEMIRLVMLHTSQSVALDRYSEITEALLNEANVHSEELERSGRLKISSKNLKKFIGKTLNLKNRISENLYIFDSPDVTWEDEQLATLDYHLKQTFDLKNRYFAIEKRITIIKENLELFKGIWDHRESSTLEWIIIILIVIEVIDMFVLKFF